MNLNRSNGQKKILINANILTNIWLIISYLLHSILISKPNKKKTSNSLSLSTFGVQSLCLSVCLRLTLYIAPPPLFQVAARNLKKKKTNRINVLGVFCFYCEYKSLLHHFSKKKKKKPSWTVGVCEYSVSWVTIILAHSNCRLVLFLSLSRSTVFPLFIYFNVILYLGFALSIHLFAKKVESFLFVSTLFGIKRNQADLFLLICLVPCFYFSFLFCWFICLLRR